MHIRNCWKQQKTKDVRDSGHWAESPDDVRLVNGHQLSPTVEEGGRPMKSMAMCH